MMFNFHSRGKCYSCSRQNKNRPLYVTIITLILFVPMWILRNLCPRY